MAAIGTWSFSLPATKSSVEGLLKGKSVVESLVNSIKDVEDDADTGVYIVGRGGFPNAEGIVELDAAIMDGNQCKFGAVAALQGVGTPIKVAYEVMQKSPHSVLVGTGAQKFARELGFEIEPNEALLPPQRSEMGSSDNHTAPEDTSHHDTLAVIVLDQKGNIAAGLSSSGAPGKYSGRVGDGPLAGCGLYADNNVGAACVTGDGDDMLRFCPSFLAVEFMRQGATPQQACTQVIQRVTTSLGKPDMEMGIIAMNVKGAYGASGVVKTWKDERTQKIYNGFPYSYSKVAPDENSVISDIKLAAPVTVI